MSLAGAAAEFDFGEPGVLIDDRLENGETRYRTFVRIGDARYALAFTVDGEGLRPISVRRAHDKEMGRHGL